MRELRSAGRRALAFQVSLLRHNPRSYSDDGILASRRPRALRGFTFFSVPIGAIGFIKARFSPLVAKRQVSDTRESSSKGRGPHVG